MARRGWREIGRREASVEIMECEDTAMKIGEVDESECAIVNEVSHISQVIKPNVILRSENSSFPVANGNGNLKKVQESCTDGHLTKANGSRCKNGFEDGGSVGGRRTAELPGLSGLSAIAMDYGETHEEVDDGEISEDETDREDTCELTASETRLMSVASVDESNGRLPSSEKQLDQCPESAVSREAAVLETQPSSSSSSGFTTVVFHTSRKKVSKAMKREQEKLIRALHGIPLTCHCEQKFVIGPKATLDRFSNDYNNAWADYKGAYKFPWVPAGFELTAKTTICQARMSVNGKSFLCCRFINGDYRSQLYHASPRHPLSALCDVHIAAIREHLSCPGCGEFCEIGEFRSCTSTSGHLYHAHCVKANSCLHCRKPTKHAVVSVEGPPLELVSFSVLNDKLSALALSPRQPVPDELSIPPCRYYRELATGFRISCIDLPQEASHTLRDVLTEFPPLDSILFGERHLLHFITTGNITKVLDFVNTGSNLALLYAQAAKLLDSGHTQYHYPISAPIHLAIKEHQIVILSILLQIGFPIHLPDKDGFIPYETAAISDNHEALVLLKKYFATFPPSSVREVSIRKLMSIGRFDAVALLFRHGYFNISEFSLNENEIKTVLVGMFGADDFCTVSNALECNHLISLMLFEDYAPDVMTEIINKPWSEFAIQSFVQKGVRVRSPLPFAELATDRRLSGLVSDVTNGCAVSSRRHSDPSMEVLSDLSFGREHHPVPVVNELDSAPLLPFHYASNSVVEEDGLSTLGRKSFEGCSCGVNGCNPEQCACLKAVGCVLLSEDRRLDLDVYDGQPIVECGQACSCLESCRNRISQSLSEGYFEVFRQDDPAQPWGLRSKLILPPGFFVGKVVGSIAALDNVEQILSLEENELQLIESCERQLSIQVTRSFANFTRFVGRGETGNVIPVPIRSQYDIDGVPQIAFFTKDVVGAYEPLVLDGSYMETKLFDREDHVRVPDDTFTVTHNLRKRPLEIPEVETADEAPACSSTLPRASQNKKPRRDLPDSILSAASRLVIWEFIVCLLDDPSFSNVVNWTDKERRRCVVEDPEELNRLWNSYKFNAVEMNADGRRFSPSYKILRNSLRRYTEAGIISLCENQMEFEFGKAPPHGSDLLCRTGDRLLNSTTVRCRSVVSERPNENRRHRSSDVLDTLCTNGHSSKEGQDLPEWMLQAHKRLRVWEFVICLLDNASFAYVVRWEDSGRRKFEIKDPEEITRLFNYYKANAVALASGLREPTASYVRFRETLRYCWKSGVLEPLVDQFRFAFVNPAPTVPELLNEDERPLVTQSKEAETIEGKPKDEAKLMKAIFKIQKRLCMWQFVVYLLDNNCSDIVDWMDRGRRKFQVNDPEKIVELWNSYKMNSVASGGRETLMSYTNFAKNLRHSSQRGLIEHGGTPYLFQFTRRAPTFDEILSDISEQRRASSEDAPTRQPTEPPTINRRSMKPSKANQEIDGVSVISEPPVKKQRKELPDDLMNFSKRLKVWEFLICLLDDESFSNVIAWTDKKRKGFEVKDSDEVTRLWNFYKLNAAGVPSGMRFAVASTNGFKESIRYCSQSGILENMEPGPLHICSFVKPAQARSEILCQGTVGSLSEHGEKRRRSSVGPSYSAKRPASARSQSETKRPGLSVPESLLSLSKQLRIWEFIICLLDNKKFGHIAKWADRERREFEIVDTNEITRLWNDYKAEAVAVPDGLRTPTKSFDNFKEALRRHERHGVIEYIGHPRKFRFFKRAPTMESILQTEGSEAPRKATPSKGTSVKKPRKVELPHSLLTTKRLLSVWEFVLFLLDDPAYAHVVRWADKERKLFEVKETEEITRLWNFYKARASAACNHRPTSNYGIFKRGLRKCADRGILKLGNFGSIDTFCFAKRAPMFDDIFSTKSAEGYWPEDDEHHQQAADMSEASDAEEEATTSRASRSRTSAQIPRSLLMFRRRLTVWEFVVCLLDDRSFRNVVQWTDKERRGYEVKDPEEIINLWNCYKQKAVAVPRGKREVTTSYEVFKEAFRRYIRIGVFEDPGSLKKEQTSFKFVKPAPKRADILCDEESEGPSGEESSETVHSDDANTRAWSEPRKLRSSSVKPCGSLPSSLISSGVQLTLHQFLIRLLDDDGFSNAVTWTNNKRQGFRIVDTKELTRLWNLHKDQQTTYENLSRSLRMYVKKGILEAVGRLMFKFTKPAPVSPAPVSTETGDSDEELSELSSDEEFGEQESADESGDEPIVPRSGNKSRSAKLPQVLSTINKRLLLWEFVICVLEDPLFSHIAKWSDKKKRSFQIKDTDGIVQLWNLYKRKTDSKGPRKPTSSYKNFSTVLRKARDVVEGCDDTVTFKFLSGAPDLSQILSSDNDCIACSEDEPEESADDEPEESSDNEPAKSRRSVTPYTPRRKPGSELPASVPMENKRLLLWEFIICLLDDPAFSHVAIWSDKRRLGFQIVDPDEIIRLWNVYKVEGTHSGRRDITSSYSNFSRALKYFADNGIMEQVEGVHTFKFAKQAPSVDAILRDRL